MFEGTPVEPLRTSGTKTSSIRSTIEIRPIAQADVARVSQFLAREMGRGAAPERYRRILETSWSAERPNYGFLLEDDSGIGGVLGAIYSEQTLDGTRRRFCNLTSWCVAPAHRQRSLGLLQALLAQPNYVFTNFSPTRPVEKIMEYTGFQRLSSAKLLILPVPSRLQSGGARVLSRPDEVRGVLSDSEQRVFDDHARYRCGQFALVRGNDYCHVVTVRRGRQHMYFADVLYASRPEWLEESLSALLLPVLLRHGTPILGVDARFVRHPPRSTYALARPAYVRDTGGVPLQRISSLYTEMVSIYG